jgi:hypothetical protein
MSTRLRFVVVALALAGFIGTPETAGARPAGSTGPRQDAPATPVDKDSFKTLLSAGDMSGDAAAAGLDAAAPQAGFRSATNVQVSRDQDPAAGLRSGASETTVAAALDSFRAVAGWNDGEGFQFAPFTPGTPALGLSGFGFTHDGGRTWTDGGAPPMGNTVAFGPGTQGRSATGNYVTRGDPWLDVDSGLLNPTFYYANLAVWEDDAAAPPAGISIHRGQFDRRGNFAWGDSVLVQSPNYPNDFLDKEALAVDRRGGHTALYVSVTNFEEVCNIPTGGFGTIEMYRSLDGGMTWARTIIQPDETIVTDPADPACGQDGVVNQGSMPVVAPNGDVYVTWERGFQAPDAGGSVLARPTIAFARSGDQGAIFTAPSQVASICGINDNEPAAYNRTNSNDFPRIAVAKSGLHRGRIYISYHDCSPAAGSAASDADTDVFVTFSDDRGATWSTPTPVHAIADGKQQFWPVVSVDLLGRVDVTYYQMQDINVTPDPNDIECSVRTGGPLNDPILKQSTVTTFSDVFRVRSNNGGRTWGAPQRVTDVTTNWCRATPINSIIPNFGDYNTSVSRLFSVFAVWADGRNAGIVDRVPTVFFSRL